MKRLLVAVLALGALAVTLTACAAGQADKADPVGSTTATFNGYWASTVSERYVFVYFKYGTTTAYGRTAAARVEDGACVPSFTYYAACFRPGPPNTIHKYAAGAQGLTPNTVYHFRLCANDIAANASYNCGNDRTFKTSP